MIATPFLNHYNEEFVKTPRKFCFLFLLFAGCTRGGEGKIPVTVASVGVEQKMAQVSAAAILEPSEKTEIQFPLLVKIDQVYAKLGSTVAAGDPLFSLNEQEFGLQLTQLKTKLMEQEALAEKNTYFLRNRDRLLEEGKIDQSMFDTLEAEVKTLESKAGQLKNEIAMIESQMRGSVITAPFAGVVTARNMGPGGSLPPHQTALTLLQINPILVSFSMEASDAVLIEKGSTVEVTVKGFEGKKYTGNIFFISGEVEAGEQTVTVKGQIPNDNQFLKAGMEAHVEFVSPRLVKILSVASSAVETDGNKEYVYIVRENRAWRVRVYTRRFPDNTGRMEILEGLKETDIVVTQGQEKLTNGAEVNLWR